MSYKAVADTRETETFKYFIVMKGDVQVDYVPVNGGKQFSRVSLIREGVFNDFSVSRVEQKFQELRPLFHICSPENFPVFFVDEKGFKDGTTILALCAKSFKGLKLIAYQLMNNHFHCVVSCDEIIAEEFVRLYIKILERYLLSRLEKITLRGIIFKIFPIETSEHLRNTIAYVNRNGFVAHNSYTPFSYPWGTSPYYFSFDAQRRFDEQKVSIVQSAKRKIARSHLFDDVDDLYLVDGYASPFSFCYIKDGEQSYRSAKQYFYTMAKNVESNADIAKIIGESLFYTDEDLFNIARSMACDKYNGLPFFQLTPDAKIEIARQLHFKYNAGLKQIQRLLKIERGVLHSLFPQSSF